MEERIMHIDYFNDSGRLCTSYYPGYVSHRLVTIDSSLFIEISYNIRLHGSTDEVILITKTKRILWSRVYCYSVVFNYASSH